MGCGEGGRASGGFFFGALAKGDVSSSIALAGRGFLPKSCPLINPRRMREGYGTWFVVHSFTHSFVRSVVRSVHRAAETIAHF